MKKQCTVTLGKRRQTTPASAEQGSNENRTEIGLKIGLKIGQSHFEWLVVGNARLFMLPLLNFSLQSAAFYLNFGTGLAHG